VEQLGVGGIFGLMAERKQRYAGEVDGQEAPRVGKALVSMIG